MKRFSTILKFGILCIAITIVAINKKTSSPAAENRPLHSFCLSPHLSGLQFVEEHAQTILSEVRDWQGKGNSLDSLSIGDQKLPLLNADDCQAAYPMVLQRMAASTGRFVWSKDMPVDIRLPDGARLKIPLDALLRSSTLDIRRAMLIRTEQMLEEEIPPDRFWGPFQAQADLAHPPAVAVVPARAGWFAGTPSLQLGTVLVDGKPLPGTHVFTVDAGLKAIDPQHPAFAAFNTQVQNALLFRISSYGVQGFKQLMEQFNHYYGIAPQDVMYSTTIRNAGIFDTAYLASVDDGTRYSNALGNKGFLEALDYCMEESTLPFQATVQRGLKLFANDHTWITVYEARPGMIFYPFASLAEVWTMWANQLNQPRDMSETYRFLYDERIGGRRAFKWMVYDDMAQWLSYESMAREMSAKNHLWLSDFPGSHMFFVQHLSPFMRNGEFDLESLHQHGNAIQKAAFELLYRQYKMPRITDPEHPAYTIDTFEELEEFLENGIFNIKRFKEQASPRQVAAFRHLYMNGFLHTDLDPKRIGIRLHMDFMILSMRDYLTQLGHEGLEAIPPIENPLAPGTRMDFYGLLSPWFTETPQGGTVFDMTRFFSEAKPREQQALIILYLHHFLKQHHNPIEFRNLVYQTLEDNSILFHQYARYRGAQTPEERWELVFLADAVLRNIPKFDERHDRVLRPARAAVQLVLGYNLADEKHPVARRADGGEGQARIAELIRRVEGGDRIADQILIPAWSDGLPFLQATRIRPPGPGESESKWTYQGRDVEQVEEVLLKFFTAMALPESVVPTHVKRELLAAFRELVSHPDMQPGIELRQAA